MAKATTLNQVNKAIFNQIHPDIFLAKSEGCFFVASDNKELGLRLSSLNSTTIYTCYLNQLTVSEWVAEVKRIFNQIDWTENINQTTTSIKIR